MMRLIKERLVFSVAFSATLAVVVVALLITFEIDKIAIDKDSLEKLNFIGAFSAGVANVAAIIWLCATMMQQQSDLGAQIKHLADQRLSIGEMSKSAHAQFISHMFDAIKSSLSYDLRYMIMLSLNKREETLLEDVDKVFFSGDRDRYFRLILENEEVQRTVCEMIAASNPALMHYANRFLQQSDNLRVLLSHDDSLSRIMMDLYKNGMIGPIRDLINHSISRS